MTALLINAIVLALAVAAFRAVPFVAWAVGSRALNPRVKAATLILFVLVVIVLARARIDTQELVARAPLALGYFCLVGLFLYELRRLAQSPGGRLGLGALIIVLYLVAPALLLPSLPLAATLAVGWEMAFAGFSMVCSASAQLRRTDALFFLLVDPSLVFTHRARPVKDSVVVRERARGARRSMIGLLFLSAQTLIASWLQQFVFHRPWWMTLDGFAAGYLGLLVASLGGVFAIFLAHAGLAHLQIGYLRMAGFAVMERYNRPYLATSPADFWRRWNVWLGTWARIYLYLPLARAIGRRTTRLRSLGTISALLGTFLFMGLAHDFVPVLFALNRGSSIQAPFVMTAFFLAAGLLVIIWDGATRAFCSNGRSSKRRTATTLIVRVLFIHVAAAFGWAVVPIVTQRTLPQPLLDLLRMINVY